MSMHLEGPWLSTTGKQRAKKKFRSAEHKRQHEELQADWNDLVNRYKPTEALSKTPASLSSTYKLGIPAWRQTREIPSASSGVGNAALKPAPVYTGTKVKGIGTMHKSNAVPVFSDDEAVEISKMRR